MDLDKSELDGDKIFDDPRFDSDTREIIEKQIAMGFPAPNAAAEANIPRSVFNRWMETDEFRNWIGKLSDKYIGGLHGVINDAINDIEKPKEQADIAIKHLERVSPIYGTKHVDVTEKKSSIERINHDPEFKQMLEDAEQAANGNDGI